MFSLPMSRCSGSNLPGSPDCCALLTCATAVGTNQDGRPKTGVITWKTQPAFAKPMMESQRTSQVALVVAVSEPPPLGGE
jgi:hypothetical protein